MKKVSMEAIKKAEQWKTVESGGVARSEIY